MRALIISYCSPFDFLIVLRASLTLASLNLPVAESIIEEQRRIHALEAQREQEHRSEAPRREEPPAFLVKQETPNEEFRRPEPTPAPRVEQPRIDPKELLDSAGLVMIETDRSKAPVQPQPEEPVHLGRPRRERPKPQEDDELKQVETKR